MSLLNLLRLKGNARSNACNLLFRVLFGMRRRAIEGCTVAADLFEGGVPSLGSSCPGEEHVEREDE